MSRQVQRTYDRWRDMDGTPVRVGARVEQTETDARMCAPRSRLYRRGQVTSRGATWLVVRFDCEDQTAPPVASGAGRQRGRGLWWRLMARNWRQRNGYWTSQRTKVS